MKKPLGLFLILALPLICFAQEIKQPLGQADKSPTLTLTIKSDKKVYKVGEEIKITAYFKNQLDEVITAVIGEGRSHFRNLKVSKEVGR